MPTFLQKDGECFVIHLSLNAKPLHQPLRQIEKLLVSRNIFSAYGRKPVCLVPELVMLSPMDLVTGVSDGPHEGFFRIKMLNGISEYPLTCRIHC